MAYKCLCACDGGDCNRLGLYINWHRRQIDCNQLESCIDEYIVKLIAISSDHVSMDVDSGFDGVFDGGFDAQFHLAVMELSTSAKHSTAQPRGFCGYQPRGFNGLIVKGTRCFTDLFYRLC